MLGIDRHLSLRIFEFFDMDGNGEIDEFEFVCTLAHLTKNEMPDRIEAIFRIFDLDNTQTCDISEFEELIETIMTIQKKIVYSAEEIKSHIHKLKETHYIKEDTVNVVEFSHMVWSDYKLKEALITIGIIGRNELDEGEDAGDNELNMEINRYQIAGSNTEEQFELKRKDPKLKENIGDDLLEFIEENNKFSGLGNLMGGLGIGEESKPAFDLNSEAPDIIVKLELIYGYRGQDMRMNLFYTPSEKLVYNIGQFGVQIDPGTGGQKHFLQGSEEIVAIDTYKNITATGEMGEFPIINLWDNDTMECIMTFTGPIERGVSMLRFSNDGRSLAVATLDDDSTIFVFSVDAVVSGDLRNAQILKFEGPKEILLDLKFESDNKMMVACSLTDVYFIQEGTKGMTLFPSLGWGGKNPPKQTSICIALLRADIFIGALDGNILNFKGTNLFRGIEAHEGPVYSLVAKPNDEGLISGGRDGIVIEWNCEMEKIRTIDLKASPDLLKPSINAIAYDYRNKTISIGTKGCNILQIDKNDKIKVLMAGHFEKKIQGMTMVPGKEELITCGEDCMIARWDVNTTKLLKFRHLPFMASKCDVSADGKYLGVGCSNGIFLLLDVESFQEKHKCKDRFKEVSDLKFSPDCKKIAVAGKDNLIIIYDVPNVSNRIICKGHHSPITSIDWSVDSKYLHSNSSLFEELFWDATSGMEVDDFQKGLSKEKWATWSALTGWASQGLWAESNEGIFVTSVTRSPNGNLIASADEFGSLKIFRNPSTDPKSNFVKVSAHSASIGNIRFSNDSLDLFSICDYDRSLIKWKIIPKKSEHKIYLNAMSEDVDDFLIAKEIKEDTDILSKILEMNFAGVDEGGFVEKLKDLADHQQLLLHEKQFEKEAKLSAPPGTRLGNNAKEPPESNLYMKYAFGYRSFDTKKNAFFLDKSELVIYPVGALSVILDTSNNTQDIFSLQEEDVVSIDTTWDNKMAVSSTYSLSRNRGTPDWIVWDTRDLTEKARLEGFHNGKVCLSRFSLDSKWILSIGMDSDHTLAVHEWSNDRLICTAKIGTDKLYDADWQDKNSFVTIGSKHIKFWIIKLNSATSMNGVWGESEAEPLVSCQYAGNTCFTGSAFGNIIPWNNMSKGKSIKAHHKAVNCLSYNRELKIVVSGGKDGLVKVWKFERGNITEPVVIYNSVSEHPNLDKRYLAIRDLDTHDDGNILIGLKCAKLIKVLKGKQSLVMEGHFDGKVSSLACHPTDSLCVTGSGDKTLRLWDVVKNVCVQNRFVDADVRALDWSRDGEIIAAGTRKGEIILFDSKLKEIARGQTEFSKPEYKISDLKFHPEGDLIAIGAQGPAGLLILVKQSEKKVVEIMKINVGFSKGITRLDWSTCGNFIVANSQKFELKFISIRTKAEMKAEETREIDWATWTCTMGYPVQGIYPAIQGLDVRTTCRSNNRLILATGDDFQKVNIFRYPSVHPKSGRKVYPGHSSLITRVNFCLNDNCLVSCGGLDKTIIVWATDFGEDHPKKQEFLEDMSIEFNPIDEVRGVNARSKFDEEGKKISTNVVQKCFIEFPGTPIVIEENFEGDESAQDVPWMGGLKAPSDFTKQDPEMLKKPEVKMVLEHVYGYRIRYHDIKQGQEEQPKVFGKWRGFVPHGGCWSGSHSDFKQTAPFHYRKLRHNLDPFECRREDLVLGTGTAEAIHHGVGYENGKPHKAGVKGTHHWSG